MSFYGMKKSAAKSTTHNRHGMYRPDMVNVNIRLRQEDRRRLEKRADELGLSLVDYIRHLLATDTRNVVLTREDAALITERIAENEKRQQRKLQQTVP